MPKFCFVLLYSCASILPAIIKMHTCIYITIINLCIDNVSIWFKDTWYNWKCMQNVYQFREVVIEYELFVIDWIVFLAIYLVFSFDENVYSELLFGQEVNGSGLVHTIIVNVFANRSQLVFIIILAALIFTYFLCITINSLKLKGWYL